MANDYFFRPRRETKIEAVERIKREHGFYEIEGSAQKKITPEDRREIERYLSRHDEFFALGVKYEVGDPEGDLDVE